MFTRMQLNGAPVEPRTVGLVTMLDQALETHGLPEMRDVIRRRLYEVALCQQPCPTLGGREVWRLTEWGELTVIEIANVVTSPVQCRGDKRAGIFNALAMAGYFGGDAQECAAR